MLLIASVLAYCISILYPMSVLNELHEKMRKKWLIAIDCFDTMNALTLGVSKGRRWIGRLFSQSRTGNEASRMVRHGGVVPQAPAIGNRAT